MKNEKEKIQVIRRSRNFRSRELIEKGGCYHNPIEALIEAEARNCLALCGESPWEIEAENLNAELIEILKSEISEEDIISCLQADFDLSLDEALQAMEA